MVLQRLPETTGGGATSLETRALDTPCQGRTKICHAERHLPPDRCRKADLSHAARGYAIPNGQVRGRYATESPRSGAEAGVGWRVCGRSTNPGEEPDVDDTKEILLDLQRGQVGQA